MHLIWLPKTPLNDTDLKAKSAEKITQASIKKALLSEQGSYPFLGQNKVPNSATTETNRFANPGGSTLRFCTPFPSSSDG